MWHWPFRKHSGSAAASQITLRFLVVVAMRSVTSALETKISQDKIGQVNN